MKQNANQIKMFHNRITLYFQNNQRIFTGHLSARIPNPDRLNIINYFNPCVKG